MKLIFKLIWIPGIWLASFQVLPAQTSVFRHTKEEVYHKNTLDGPWELTTVRRFKYNYHGDVTSITVYDGNEVPISRDSMIYNEEFQLLELYKFNWSLTGNEFEKILKITNCYEGSKSCGSRVYQWNNKWELSSGSEIIRNHDQSNKTETILSRYYDSKSQKWKNSVKEILEYDEIGRVNIKTLYSANPFTNLFEPFSRSTYKDWFNYEKNIYQELINEKYISDKWELESTSKITRSGGIWINLESRTLTNETYRILFDDDDSYREVMLASNPGWLTLSVYQKDDNLEKLIENNFENDSLKSIRKRIIETNDIGRKLQYFVEEVTPAGDILEYSDVVHELTYGTGDLLLEDIAKVKTDPSGDYFPVIKAVYSDYTDVSVVLGNDHDLPNESVTIFPNPGNGLFYLETAEMQPLEIKIYDQTGTVVFQKHISDHKFDVSHLPSGIYLLRMESAGFYSTHKIAIQ